MQALMIWLESNLICSSKYKSYVNVMTKDWKWWIRLKYWIQIEIFSSQSSTSLRSISFICRVHALLPIKLRVFDLKQRNWTQKLNRTVGTKNNFLKTKYSYWREKFLTAIYAINNWWRKRRNQDMMIIWCYLHQNAKI